VFICETGRSYKPLHAAKIQVVIGNLQKPGRRSLPPTGNTCLSVKGFLDMILERAPNTTADYADADGDTALISAARYQHADIVRLLADFGADVNWVDKGAGFTPLFNAVLPIHPGLPPRHPDPDGARELAAVRALLRLGACTSPPSTPTGQAAPNPR
jgi:ankyrin repeat protein